MSILTEVQRLSQAKADLKASIEAKGVTVDETATLDTYASKVDEVYSKGYEAGKAEGGGDSYYDEFWDNYQEYGNRTNYNYAFSGIGWSDVTFDPKYSLYPTLVSAQYMFYLSTITDLDKILKDKGLMLDTSKCNDFTAMFYNSTVTRLGVIDCSKANTRTRVSATFRTSTLQSIEKVILPTENIACDSTMFGNTTSLTHVIFEGTIYQNFTINMSTLDLESAKSIILALENYAGTDKEFSYKITLSAGTWAVLDADGETAPHGGTWRDYVGTLGWDS